MKIWCVEDDENINNLITYALQSQGFEAMGFHNYKEFKENLKITLPNVIMLDIMLPDTDGITILKNLKSDVKLKNIPVVMLTAKNSEIDIVKALDLGAEDYITKPFGVLEMVSRVKAVLRRCTGKASEENCLKYGDISILKDRHTVLVKDENIELTLKEYSVLQLLMENPEKVFTRENIMDSIWGDSYVGESRTVDMHIKTLRQKLGTAGESIATVRGVGYKIKM